MITVSFWVLFALAFVMSMEFGQTAVEIVRQGTRQGFRNAFLVSLGAVFAEFLFLALTLTGLIFFFNNAEALKFVWLGGGMIVIFLGVQGLQNYRYVDSISTTEGRDNFSGIKPFAAGVGINFLHPLNLVWWAGTLGPVILESIHQHGYTTAVVNGLGVPLGGFAWWILLSCAVSYAKESFSESVVSKINLVSSIGLLLFGLYFLYRAAQLFGLGV